MLTEIYIKNYTIVETLNLALKPGLSILSGETGAGKSIIVDSVSLVLGRRADPKAIRQGHTQCSLTLCFDITNIPTAKDWLQQQGFIDSENDTECLITRTLSKDGRSRSTINGQPCPLGLVKELSAMLLVIHGQHESQHLLQQTFQQHYIDQFGKHTGLLKQLHAISSDWHRNETELTELKAQAETRHDQLNLLTYQLDELENLSLNEGEWQTLHQENQTLHQASSLIANLNSALDLASENERANALNLLHEAVQHLESTRTPEKSLQNVIEMLNTAKIHLQEATEELSHYRNSLDLSPERLQFIEQRLTLIHDLARKHHVTPEELHLVKKSIEQKIEKLDASDELIQEITRTQQSLLANYQDVANQLTKKRIQAANKISKKITEYMQQLGMQGGEFKVELTPATNKMHASGQEKINFLVKTNPGQSLQALSTVVSGGELSRISLALQAIVAQTENTPTFIFDEVDTGIGGKTAEIVGTLLHSLSTNSQVFCITHLAQVASQGDHHYRVSKTSTKNSTCAQITELNHRERVEELARMISGTKISKQTLQHAEELLKEKI